MEGVRWILIKSYALTNPTNDTEQRGDWVKTRVSVIILNYNKPQLTIECLNALNRQTFSYFETVLIDNGSTNENRLVLEQEISQNLFIFPFKFLPLRQNLGFAGGNNSGLMHTKGEYIALLNNDALPDERWLEQLVKAMNENPCVGICASQMLVHDSNVIDTAGDGFVRSLKGFKRGEGVDSLFYSRKEFVFGACAGAALYRRKMIEEIGFLDDDFFIIHEDSDLNFRAQLRGWKVIYVPTAIVRHKVRSSIGKHSDLETYYTLRNSYLVKIKNAPLKLLFLCFPEIIAATIMEFIYFVIKHRKGKLYFKAMRDVTFLLPKMVSKRKSIMAGKKVKSSYLRSLMTPVYGRGVFRAKLLKLFYD